MFSGTGELVAARRRFEPRRIEVIRQVAPPGLLPTPTASSATGLGRSGRGGGANLQTRIHEGPDPDPALIITWAHLMLQRGLTAINNTKGIL